MEKQRLLVCSVPARMPVVRDALASRFSIDFCTTMAAACTALKQRPDAIVCNVDFEEGRLFDFLWMCRSHPIGKATPLVIVQSQASFSPAIMRSIEAASRTIGIDAFYNAHATLLQASEEDVYAEFRSIIVNVIQKNKVGAAGQKTIQIGIANEPVDS
jgi:CheY-like chemotaxis protein